MTAKQQALSIWESYYKNIPNMSVKDATQCAITHVKGIIEVTKPDPYPRKKTPMDREYWQEVLTELTQM